MTHRFSRSQARIGNFLLILWAVTIFPVPGFAREYYVAGNGHPENDGSRARPWPSVEFALSKVGGGNTIILQDGVYRGPIHVAKEFSGTRANPTVIKANAKWKATVAGSVEHGIFTDEGTSWVIIDGIEVLGARVDGIKLEGDFGTVRNCWVHNNAGMGVAIHGKTGWVIESNLIEFNGHHVQFHHGIYADGENGTVRNNIVRHNAAYGIHLYPSARSITITGNLVYGHSLKGGILVSCPTGGGHNIICNNTVAYNGSGIDIGAGNGEEIQNNIIVGQHAVETDNGFRGLHTDYNLCWPECSSQGPHGLSADPHFVNPSRGAYWLAAGSPAIRKGNAEAAPKQDFFGCKPRSGQRPDLGAFPYLSSVFSGPVPSGWFEGWAYGFRYEEGKSVPDLWSRPASLSASCSQP